MKDKKTGLIQTLIGAVILVIGIVLCVNTYIVKGNKAYAFSLLVTILGIVILSLQPVPALAVQAL